MAAESPTEAQSQATANTDETQSKGDNSAPWYAWHTATREGCQTAESELVSAFVDPTKLRFEIKDIPINFDPRPAKIIEQERLKLQNRSNFSFSFTNLFSRTESTDTSNTTITSSPPSNPMTNAQFETKTDDIDSSSNNQTGTTTTTHSNSMTNIADTTDNNKEFIHTVTFTPHNDLITGVPVGSSVGNNNNNVVDNNINNIETTANGDESATIVFAHGYGCAGGVYAPSINIFYDELGLKLASHDNNNNNNDKNNDNNSSSTLNTALNSLRRPNVHVIDWLGCGLSSKPKFLCEDTSDTELFFIESFEAWRSKMNINKMILIAHSLGGYMSVVYALKYPQFIQHLILVSPVGLPEPNVSDLSKYKFSTRMLLKTVRNLWDQGWTPYDIIRWSGPKGRPWVEAIVDKRLYNLNNMIEHKKKLVPLLSEYLYQSSHGSGSGEYALNKVLAPGAWARSPLIRRIGGLGKFQNNLNSSVYDVKDDANEDDNSGSNDGKPEMNGVNNNNGQDDRKQGDDVISIRSLNDNMKIDFVYGEGDWMSSNTATQLKQDKILKCNVYQVKDAGHQIMLENHVLFAKTLANIVYQGACD